MTRQAAIAASSGARREASLTAANAPGTRVSEATRSSHSTTRSWLGWAAILATLTVAESFEL